MVAFYSMDGWMISFMLTDLTTQTRKKGDSVLIPRPYGFPSQIYVGMESDSVPTCCHFSEG